MSTFDYTVTISDGSTTKTLTSSPYLIAEYHPRTADRDQEAVTETIVLRVRDGSVANNLDEIRVIQKLLKQAEDAQRDLNLTKVYINFTPTSGGATYRSEIVKARAEWLDDTLGVPRWATNSQRTSIFITRKNWWEGAEVNLDLDNDNATNSTAGVNVFNCNDGSGASPNSRVNFVSIDAADVGGDLMAPTRIEMTNLFSTGNLIQVWVGQNWTDPANVDWNFEGEDASVGGSVVTSSDQANVSMSGGQFKRFEIGSGSEIACLGWAFSSAQMDAFAGRYFKAMIRFATSTNVTDTFFRLKLLTSGGGPAVWQMQSQVKPSSSYANIIRDIFTFPIGLQNLTSQVGLELWLYLEQSSGGNLTYDIDFIQLLPVDGYRMVRGSYPIPENSRIVDDGIHEQAYTDDGSGSSKVGGMSESGMPIMLYPGKLQRLYFLQHSNSANTAEIDRQLSVKVHYRPRRLSL